MKTKLISFVLATIYLTSCASKSTRKLVTDNYFYFDTVNGNLILNIDTLKSMGIRINNIILENKLGKKQNIVLNKVDFIVSKIENKIQIKDDKDFINTYSSFNNLGNFYFDSSYFFETKVIFENDSVFLLCLFQTSHFKKQKFILNGAYSQDFSIKSRNRIDTIWFDNSDVAKIPVLNWRIGLNRKRFIIVDQIQNSDLKNRRKIYVDKEFYVQK